MHRPAPSTPKAAASTAEALHYLRLAALALNFAAKECYLEQAVEAMKTALLMEELGK